MTTTLNKIRKHSPCKEGWEKLLANLGKTKADDKELSILAILDSNGLADALWCFRAVEGHEDTMRIFARFCAEQNIEKIKAYSSAEDYDTICSWVIDGSQAARSAAWSAAESAARSAAESAAESAAWSAARSAAWSAAWSAARSAAASAAWSAASAAWSAAESAARSAAWSAQEEFLRELLS